MDTNVAERLGKDVTLTDVLGYVAPGAAAIMSIYLFESWAKQSFGIVNYHFPLRTLVTAATQDSSSGQSWFKYVVAGLALLLGIYILGHIIDSISTLTIDRLFVHKAYGYPWHRLLNLTDLRSAKVQDRVAHSESIPDLSQAYYRGLFFWLNFYFAFRCLWYVAMVTHVLNPYVQVFHTTATVTGWWVLTMPLTRVTISAVRKVGRLRLRRARAAPVYIRLGLVVLSYLYSGLWELVIGRPISKILATRRSFGEDFLRLYRHYFKETFGLDPEYAESNNYWMTYSYVMRHSSRLFSVAIHWETLAMFSRNLATAFYLSFLYTFLWLYAHPTAHQPSSLPNQWSVLAIPGVLLLLAGAMLLHYYYLYICHYSKFLYRAFVFLVATKRREFPNPLKILHDPTGDGSDASPPRAAASSGRGRRGAT